MERHFICPLEKTVVPLEQSAVLWEGRGFPVAARQQPTCAEAASL